MTQWERVKAAWALADAQFPTIQENEPTWGFADIPTVMRSGMKAGTWLNENYVKDYLWNKESGVLEQHFQRQEQGEG